MLGFAMRLGVSPPAWTKPAQRVEIVLHALPQTNGIGEFLFTDDTLTGFRGARGSGAEGEALAGDLLAWSAPGFSDPLPAIRAYWRTSALRLHDGRVAPNVLTGTPPTLSAVPDPRRVADEQGDGNPPRTWTELNDPNGEPGVTTLAFGSRTHYLIYANAPDLEHAPADFRSVAWMRALDAADEQEVALGASSNIAGAFAVSPLTLDWRRMTAETPDHSGDASYSLAVRPAADTGGMNIAITGLAAYDVGVPPDLATELAAADAMHLKAPFSHSGALPVADDGWVRTGTSGATSFENAHVPLSGEPLAAGCAMGGWVDHTTVGSGSIPHHLIGFPRQRSDTGINRDGQLGLDPNTGQLYANPNLNNIVSDVPYAIRGRGAHHLAMSLDPAAGGAGDARHVCWINGVPMFEQVDGWDVPSPEGLAIGSYSGATSKDQRHPNRLDAWADPFFDDGPLDQAAVTALVRHGIATGVASIDLTGAVVAFGDSLTAFTPSPAQAFAKDTDHPWLFALEAIGGSKYGSTSASSYEHPDRRERRVALLSAMLATGYERVVLANGSGSNDLPNGVMDGGGDWRSSQDLILNMLKEDVAAAEARAATLAGKADGFYSGKVWLVGLTITPRESLNAEDEAARMAYNDDLRASFTSLGYHSIIDTDAFQVPDGVTPGPGDGRTLKEWAEHAVANGGNAMFQSDGIHWATTGGQIVSNGLYKPAYAALAA